MAIFNIFSSCVKYKYKTSLCSFSTFIVLIIVNLTLLLPVVILYHIGGFWLRNGIYVETPEVIFKQKYLLLAEREFDTNPIICSTFTSYKENPISDDCILIKVQEVDTNKDGHKDVLKFEARFYTDLPIRSLKLLLFFNYELKEISRIAMETMSVFSYTFSHDVQKVFFIGDLKLLQRSPLHNDGIQKVHNASIELGDYSLSQLFAADASRRLLVKIVNSEVICQTGFSNDEEVVIQGEISYLQELIHYQPGIWQELKWAWIQYISVLLIFIYLAKRVLQYMFTNRYFRSYIAIPWKEK